MDYSSLVKNLKGLQNVFKLALFIIHAALKQVSIEPIRNRAQVAIFGFGLLFWFLGAA